MKTRVISAAVIIALVILITVINNRYLNLAVLAVLFFLAFEEAKLLFKAPNASSFTALFIFLIAAFSPDPLLMGLCLVLIVLGICAFYAIDLKNIFPFGYPLFPFLALWQLLDFESIITFIWLVVIVSVCDSLAYFIGKNFGKNSFCNTSPNKTWEGLIGGLFCAVVAGSLFGVFWIEDMSLGNFILISFCVGVFAIMGDLIESYFKRLAGVKDSGTLIPGHGGVLDRLDALMIAVFAMLVLL